MTDTPIGTPITTEQATRAVLRMLKTPIIGDIDKDSSPGHTLARFHRNDDEIYNNLSGGERKLVDIAQGLWSGPDRGGAEINVLGGLDRTLRRKVIVVLTYLYLGHDDWRVLEADSTEFMTMFGPKA